MRKGFTVVEVVFVVVMLGILAVAAIWTMPRTELKQATESMINNLKYTKSLAQLDDRFFGMEDANYFNETTIADKTQAARRQVEHYQCGKWQFQFHQSSGNSNATNTYTIFADSAGADSKSFDGKPMDGDSIARDPMTKACISGYNDNNLSSECKNNNFSPEARFGDSFGVEVENITSDDCTYAKNSTFSVFFDSDGMPYCKAGQSTCTSANANSLPKRLTKSVTIKLKRKGETSYICVTKGGIIDFGNLVDKDGKPRKTTNNKLRGIPVKDERCQEEDQWLQG